MMESGDTLSLTGEETQPRTLYVGNLDAQTTEEFLLLLFSQIGPVKGCKIIHETPVSYYGNSKILYTMKSLAQLQGRRACPELYRILVMTGVILFDFCESSFWDHNHGPGPGPQHRPPKQIPRIDRDRPRPMRHHRHIQAHNYHRPIPRMHRPMPPPGHRRRSPRPPPRHGPIKSYRPPGVNNQGYMNLQPMSLNHQHQHQHPPRQSHRQHFSGPPSYFQQDEILNDQTTHFPTVSNEPHTSPSYQRTTEVQPHGYLSSTYKGWKPIVKPFQDSYGRPGKPSGKEEYPRKQEYNGGPRPHNSLDNVRSHSMQTNLNMNTLFRENTERMKAAGLQPEYSEHQGVRIPLPPEVGRPVRLPQSIFMDAPWHTQFQSQSEDVPVIKKPFPKFHPKLKNAINALPNPPPVSDNGEARPPIPKFKFNRPRPRPALKEQGQQGNEQEGPSSTAKSPLQQFTPTSEELSNAPQNQVPLNLKAKLNSRGRVRVRTKVVKPFSSESDEQSLPAPRPLQPFDASRNRAPNGENSHISQSQAVPPYPQPQPHPQQNNRGPSNHGPVNPVRNHTEGAYSSPYPERGNTERPHQDRNTERNHQARPRPDNINHQEGDQRNPPPEFYARPAEANNQFHHATRGPPQNTEELKLGGGEQKHPGGGGRRRRPKGGHKNVAVQEQTTAVNNEGPTSPTFTDDFYFPPGFSPDPSKNTGQHPVSFMTMPGSKPQVIHHTYESHRPQQQQLYPINVMRSPESEYQRPNHGHGTSPNGNYIQNPVRPRFVIMNAQAASQSHSDNFQNQRNVAYPSNHHESTYSPHAYGLGSNISPYTLSTSFPSRHPMSYPRPSASVQHYGPPRVSHNPSTTLRNPYFQNSNSHQSFGGPYEMSPTMNSFEVSESSENNPYLSSPAYAPPTTPNSFLSTSPRTVYQQAPIIKAPQPTPAFSHYSPNFGSAEYDKIPMQYADQLRPILRDEPVEFSSTTPDGRHTHQSPEVHPPPDFFSGFFKPFGDSFDSFSRSPDQDLDPKSSIPVRNQIRPPYVNMDYEPYKSQSSSHVHVVPHPVSGPSFVSTPAPAASRPFSYSPQLYEGSSSMIPSVSSTHKMEYDQVSSEPSKSWSKKLKEEDHGSSTENIIRTSAPVQVQAKKTGNKVNQKQHQQQPTSPAKAEVESTRTRPRRPYGETEHPTVETPPAVTTYKPSSSSSKKVVEGHSNLANEGNGRRDRVSGSNSPSPHEDDYSDSNTPRSVRTRGQSQSQNKGDSTTARVTTESLEDSIPTTTFKSKRQFRRRRPEALVRRRYFSSRVKPEADSTEEKAEPTTQKPQSDPNDDGHQPSRLSALRHRRLFHRRKVPVSSHRQKEGEEKAVHSTSTPTSTESEAVTYGESQWFRIKPVGSSEEPVIRVTSSKSHSNKQEAQTPKTILKALADKGKYRSKTASAPVELLPLESATTEVSLEELDRTPFSLKHSEKQPRKMTLSKDSSSKKSMK